MGDAANNRGRYGSDASPGRDSAPFDAEGEERAIRQRAYQEAREQLSLWASQRFNDIELLLPQLDGPASKQTQKEAIQLLRSIAANMHEYRFDTRHPLFQFINQAERSELMHNAHQHVLDAGALLTKYRDDIEPYNSFLAYDAMYKVQVGLKDFFS